MVSTHFFYEINFKDGVLVKTKKSFGLKENLQNDLHLSQYRKIFELVSGTFGSKTSFFTTKPSSELLLCLSCYKKLIELFLLYYNRTTKLVHACIQNCSLHFRRLGDLSVYVFFSGMNFDYFKK